MKSNSSLKYVFIIVFIVLQFFFIDHYRTDKTILASQITDSIYTSKTLYGVNIPCGHWGDVTSGNYSKWAEEPPVYHLLGSIFYFIGLGDYAYRLYPIICFLLLVHALLLIVRQYDLMSKFNESWKIVFLLFMPFIYIHGHRPLPDNLSVAFLGYFIYFFYKEDKKKALVFAFLAVTTKALAIFAIFPLCLGELIDSKNRKKTFIENILFGFSVIPTLLWFYYLSKNSIPNPFFDVNSTAMEVQQSGGSNFVDLTTRKYWSRLFSWSAVRGVGVLTFVLAVWSAFKVKHTSRVARLTLFGLAGHILYVILVRGPQRAAPWYSFYFLPFYTIMFMIWADKLKDSRWVKGLIVVNVVMALTFVKYSTNFSRNMKVNRIGESGIPCQFHRYIYEKHKREGRL